MPKRAPRLFVPLDVEFFDDDRVVAAGERAGWLLLAIYAHIKKAAKDGTISRSQVSRLHVAGWQKRVDSLLEQGLLEAQNGSGNYHVPGWLKWNEAIAERESRAEQAREAAQTRWSNTKRTAKQ